MKASRYILILQIFAVTFLASCEFEKTEFQTALNPTSFHGFREGVYILHNNSISYYSPEDNKVFPDLYLHQNGFPTANGLHSFYCGFWSMITYNSDDKIEFIDEVNMLSEGFLNLETPGNIFILNSGNALISYGKNGSEGLAMLDIFERRVISSVQTGKNVNKIFQVQDHLYLFGDGSLEKDSIIEKFNLEIGSDDLLIKLDDFTIGLRPADFVEIPIYYNDYSNDGLAILCKGNEIIPPSIVLFDLVTERVINSWFFESTEINPENIFWYPEYHSWQSVNPEKERLLLSYANKKLYSLRLKDPIEMSVMVDRNVSQIVPLENYCLAVSRDTIGDESFLYRLHPGNLDIIDSVMIPSGAFELVKAGWNQ